MWGATASTNIASVAVGAELSYSPNFPVQLAAGDLLGGPAVRLRAGGILGVLGVPARVWPPR